MSGAKDFSIIISNFNYARFLRQSIDCALAQTLPNVEVIVVDDGSKDESPNIIAEYGDRIIPVVKENGGQASAFNAGFARASAPLILFLDSDDILYPDAAEKFAAEFSNPAVVKVAALLLVVDALGQSTGRMVPKGSLPSGSLLSTALFRGPSSHACPPTSGNAWRRSYLEKVMPVPEGSFRICADAYLFMLTPLFGEVRALPMAIGCYRIHGNNNWAYADSIVTAEAISRAIDFFEMRCNIMEKVILPEQNVSASAWRYRDFGHFKLVLLRWRLFGVRWRGATLLDLLRFSLLGAADARDIVRVLKVALMLIGPREFVQRLAAQSLGLLTRSASS